MTFKPTTWYPIAIVLSIANVAAVAFATGAVHTTSHAVLALAFGLWAQQLRQKIRKTTGSDELQSGDTLERLDALEAETSTLRRELGEAQERLDFAERLLAQRQEPRRVGPEP
jgi:hypothetical protein